mmetsp:Transcript_40988/g.75021  ORF Transcript_40988/g.75021 Transcript_40988/m.75021 type:complete len:133 (-) Transcript_40988:275-673(-)
MPKMVDHQFLQRIIALLLVFQPALIKAFHIPKSGNKIINTCLSMGLYEDEIDWDADLFGQIGKSGNNKQLTPDIDGSQKNKDGAESDALDDSNWDTGQKSKSKNNVKSMREQMKQSWGVVDKKEEEGKPNAD